MQYSAFTYTLNKEAVDLTQTVVVFFFPHCFLYSKYIFPFLHPEPICVTYACTLILTSNKRKFLELSSHEYNIISISQQSKSKRTTVVLYCEYELAQIYIHFTSIKKQIPTIYANLSPF